MSGSKRIWPRTDRPSRMTTSQRTPTKGRHSETPTPIAGQEPSPGPTATSQQPMADDPRSAGRFGGLRGLLKALANTMALALVALPALTCGLEARFGSRSEVFLFWGQLLALVPGLPGKYLRRAFYHLVLQSCDLSCDLGFLSYFNDRRTEVGPHVYVGFGVVIGLASLGEGCMIGSRASVINGGHQHQHGEDGRLTHFDAASARRVQIGPHCWLGEGSIVMADLGPRTIVAAGGVVTQAVPGGSLVGGVPARILRGPDDGSAPDSQPRAG